MNYSADSCMRRRRSQVEVGRRAPCRSSVGRPDSLEPLAVLRSWRQLGQQDRLWHSPVTGTVVRAVVVDGTYFSEADTEGADATEPRNSQGYMAHVATRAVIVLQADDPGVGLVAFIPVGMSEVSSCVIGEHVVPGRHVRKGDELGHFQFGGSTCCLVFQPGALHDISLATVPQPDNPKHPLMLVNSRLAAGRDG